MNTHQPTGTPHVDHEESDVNVAVILKAGGWLFAAMLVVLVVVWGVLSLLDARQTGTTDFPMAVGETRLPPAPRLQVSPREEMQQLRESQEQTLSSYSWVDRELGIVRIPIDLAMRLTVERGLPTRPASEPGAGDPQP